MIIYKAYFRHKRFRLLTKEGCFVFIAYVFTIFLYMRLKFSYKIFSLSVQIEMLSTDPYAKLFTNTVCFILKQYNFLTNSGSMFQVLIATLYVQK